MNEGTAHALATFVILLHHLMSFIPQALEVQITKSESIDAIVQKRGLMIYVGLAVHVNKNRLVYSSQRS